MSDKNRKLDYLNLHVQTGSATQFAPGGFIGFNYDSGDISRIGFTAKPFVTAAAPVLESEIIEEIIRSSGAEDPLITMYNDLKRFEKLSPGWDGYEAEAPNLIATHWCYEIIQELVRLDFLPAGLTPSVEGGVGVYFEQGNKYADIECLNNQNILAVMSEGDGEPEVWEVERTDLSIKEAVKRISDFFTNKHPRSVSLRRPHSC